MTLLGHSWSGSSACDATTRSLLKFLEGNRPQQNIGQLGTFTPKRYENVNRGPPQVPSRITSQKGQTGQTPPIREFVKLGSDNDRNHHTIEIPACTLLVISLLALLWFVTSAHTIENEEISFQEFVNNYLVKDKVQSLYVVNGSFVRIVLKRPWNSTNGKCNYDAEKDDVICLPMSLKFPDHLPPTHLSHTIENAMGEARYVLNNDDSRGSREIVSSSSNQIEPRNIQSKNLGILNHIRFSGYKVLKKCLRVPDNKSTLRFRVGDLTRLELLLLSSVSNADTRTMPPIYYVKERDRIALLQSHLPIFLLIALSFVSISNKQPALSVSETFGGDSVSRIPPSINSAQDRLMRFGKATPKTNLDIPRISFNDVAGLEQAKKEISEFVDFLKCPKRFTDLGAEVPKGALLIGPPGTGKTLLARAVAGEASVPFFSMSGSDFIEMFVGIGPSRVRDLFEKARQNAPAIVFIDEIDTIGRSRGAPNLSGSGGSDERESTLNALLVELDGFSTTKNGVVILAGTNRGDVLDPALTRPGRFDRRIELSKPSVSERKAIFDIHLKPVKLNEKRSREAIAGKLAALTPGFSGAEIRSVCNEAAIIAARRAGTSVECSDLEAAVERMISGLKETGEVLSGNMRSQVAYHEAGHAIVGWFNAEADPVLKLSIVPRANGSLGFTQMMPEEVLLASKENVLSRISVLLGGRASEELFCKSITTGASDDLERATKLAKACVCSLGFMNSKSLRTYSHGHNESSPGFYREYSESTAQYIDKCVDQILREQYERAIDLLRKKEQNVKDLANLLLEQEVVSYNDLVKVLGPSPRVINLDMQNYIQASACMQDNVDDEIAAITQLEGVEPDEDALITQCATK